MRNTGRYHFPLAPLKWNTLPFRGYQSTSLPGFVNHPGRGFVYKHIDILFKDTIDWVLLETHWTDLIQVVLSVRVGKLQPSILLRKPTQRHWKRRRTGVQRKNVVE